MDAVSYTAFRANLRGYIDKARDDAEPILVTSRDPSANVVVINAHDYDNLVENLRVSQNAYLMEKIARGREQFDRGNVIVRNLIEDEDD